jgi:tetratricopeptide (TPR) repeat protein
MLPEAMALIREAAGKQPRNALYLFYLALALGKSNDIAAAERQLSRAIELDPSRKEFFIELCTLYGREGRLQDLAATIDRYLAWNPQSIGFRLQRPKINPKEP